MTELRWILLLLGSLFIVALAIWELRKTRRARREAPEARPVPREAPSEPLRIHREPTLTLPEIRTRDTSPELPVVEVPDDSLIGLRIDGERIEEIERDQTPPPAPEPIVPEPQSPPRAAAAPPPLEVPPPAAPVVEWPREEERQILAIRLAAIGPERLHGRVLRQALAAEGFVHGKFSIFHRAGPDSRALLSAASLTKPGTFDLESMDMQRFVGVNLFAVLPGPLPPLDTFDELLATARNLNERLNGALQDERGEPLTPMRIAGLRERLAATPPADAGPAP